VKTLSQPLADHLATGATTLCWCWRLERGDGTVLGFTDHDRDVAFDGTDFEALSGIDATELKESVGLNVDNLEVEGGVTSDRLSETELAAGRYDDARVEIYRVNWQDPTQRVLMRTGSIGEVRRAGLGFVAEIRGLAHYFNQPTGRLFQYTCDADLGDARCGVDIETSALAAIGTVTSQLSPHVFDVTGLDAFPTAWFDHGKATITTGANASQIIEIKSHENLGASTRLTAWQAIVAPLAAGDQVDARGGCDKTLETCHQKFDNVANFRGCPHMPGNDFITTIFGSGRT
jgi:uncharacterized phage protein (TIGR02218 family)